MQSNTIAPTVQAAAIRDRIGAFSSHCISGGACIGGDRTTGRDDHEEADNG